MILYRPKNMRCVFLPELFSLYGPELNSKSRVLLFYKVSNKKIDDEEEEDKYREESMRFDFPLLKYE